MPIRSLSPAKRAAATALAVAWPGLALALPADAAHGEKLAKQWCAACHIVAADQAHGRDDAPSFASVAAKQGFSPDSVSRFLMDPHPKMPDMQLTRDESRDLGAYIATLAK